MTVIPLDDRIWNNSCSADHGTNNANQLFLHSDFQCQSILRNSTTYRWTTTSTSDVDHLDGTYQHEEVIESKEYEDRGKKDDNSGDSEGMEDVSHSSATSSIACPIPEFIMVYKNE